MSHLTDSRGDFRRLKRDLTCTQIKHNSGRGGVVDDGSSVVDVEEVVSAVESSVAVYVAQLEALDLSLDANGLVHERLVARCDFIARSGESDIKMKLTNSGLLGNFE